ncbi:hypothetical protein B0T22DRAFT_537179 [Podospora appendiculata]|uniref:Uncharacterized protein n=1 Tax=Podospora appendiculata TaxID=314037 RepID=A0AAE0XDD7_9PEZI|nr:hypothetical protein B0T22DRAFT_537179 [Podospora appendiculata]
MCQSAFTIAGQHGIFQSFAKMKRLLPLQKAADIDAAENHRKKLRLSNDRDREDQPGTASQHGNGNRQFNNFGTGSQKYAEGNYFEAKGSQNFGIAPSKESMGRKRA